MHSLLISRADRAVVLARFVSELSAEEEKLLQAVLRDITPGDITPDDITPDGDGFAGPSPHVTEPAEH
jgi:hypothetical protein